MNNQGDNIEELFKQKLQDSWVAPPQNVWNSLEASLSESFVEDLYKEKLKDDKKKPPITIWIGIQKALRWQQFLSFKYNTVNVYYTSAAVLLSLWGITMLTQNPQAHSPAVMQAQILQDKHPGKNKRTQEPAKNAEHELTNSSQIAKNNIKQANNDSGQKNNSKKTRPESKNIAGLYPQQTVTVQNKANRETIVNQPKVPFDFSNITLQGNQKICNKTPEKYTVEGINELTTCQWEIKKQAGEIIAQTRNHIEVVWQKPGMSQIELTLVAGENTKTITLQVEIHESINNQIMGASTVCQGDEDVQYNISNMKDLNKQYIWDVNSPFDIKGNGCILVDWNSAGWDTLYLIDKNNETGCNFRIAYPVQVLPKPSSRFTYTNNGNGNYTFTDNSLCKIKANCQLSSSWIIGGTTYQGNSINIQIDNTNDVYIQLTTTDDNGCFDNLTKEITLYLHKIETASGVSPSKPFMPLVSDKLESYRLQIFDNSRNKVWETTALENGMPSSGWDGTAKGTLLPEGNFYWKIEATFADGSTWKGQIKDEKLVKEGSIFLFHD